MYKRQEHILRVAREMQFQKESEIDFSEFKKVKTLGMVVPDVMSSFYHRLAEETSRHAFYQEYTVFQCYTNDDIQCFYMAVEGLMAKNVDGIIIIPPRTMDKENVKLLKSLQKSGVPMVLLDRAAYAAVSYTHLDVYKRQYMDSALEKWEETIPLII